MVFGPGTFVNTAANQITNEFGKAQGQQSKQADAAAASARKASKARGDTPAQQAALAKKARELVQSQFTREVLSVALKYGINGLPSVDNADFVSTLVFDSRKGEVGQPKARFAYLFPSKNAAAIQVRLRPDLTEKQRNRTIELIEQVTKDKTLVPKEGAEYVVTGVPVVVEGLSSAVRTSIFVLLGAALLLMAATLALVFKTRLRLLPLAIALGASALTFGALSIAGGELTMASIAVLPVLIGLAVDYSIQFHSRFDEFSADGKPPREAAPLAAGAGGPTIASAGIATAVGFLVLLLSPVPIVRGFGLLLVIGILIALACALSAGFASLVYFNERRPRDDDVPPLLPRVRARAIAAGGWLRARWEAAADSSAGRGIHRRWRVVRLWVIERYERGLAYSVHRPQRVLAVGLAVAIVGWGADTQSKVVSDIQELVPANLQALKDARTLQEESGVSGEIDVTVRAARRDRPEGHQVDDGLLGARAQGRRLSERRPLRPGEEPPGSLPGAVPARPLQLGEHHPAGPDQGPARRHPAVLLAGRRDEGPQDGEPRVRHPAAVARQAEGRGRPDQGRARPAGGRHRVRRRPAGAGRRGQRRARLARAAGADAASPRCWRCSSCCSRSAAAAARRPSR